VIVDAKYTKLGKKYKAAFGDSDAPLVLGLAGGAAVLFGVTAW
jgi:hypothetical protein